VLLTGLYQSLRWTGLDIAALVSVPVGVLILLKLGLIVALVGIFLACPMWRACSPIAGVCDITDMDPTPGQGYRTEVGRAS
jgi:putative copper resistance protein D